MSRVDRGVQLGLLAALLGAIVACAWVCDDAYVTLRTIDNLRHGFGLRFNPAERVQAFTHPLWLAVLTGPIALTGESWATVMAVGGAVTAAALVGLGRSARGGAVAYAALLGSKAAVDWSTGGLENPLEALLLVGFVAAADVPRPSVPALLGIAALLGTTRLDALVLVAPAVVAIAWASRRGGIPGSPSFRWTHALAATAPLALWHGFAVVYYGALLPNTAAAKLGTGIPAIELAGRAWGYVAWTAAIDPWTLAVIGGGLVAAGWARDRLSVALAAGVALHLGWLVHVGGDFMGGRWFVAPVWVAAAILARLPWSRAACWAAIAASGLSLASPYAPLRSTRGYVKAPAAHGVVDERGYYWAGTGAWTGSTIASGPIHPFAADGRRARSRPAAIKSVIGLYGFAAGPSHHVIDRLGLADPLLARLPAELDPGFRIGHFRRKVPDGYVASVIAGDDQLRDPDVRALYGAIRLVTRGPLWTVDRWVAIGRLAVGGYPVDRVRWRYPDVQWLVDGQGPVDVGPTGAGIVVTGVSGALRVDGTGPWTVYVERGDRIVDRRIEPGTFTVALGGLDRVVWVSDGPSRVARVTVAATGAGG